MNHLLIHLITIHGECIRWANILKVCCLIILVAWVWNLWRIVNKLSVVCKILVLIIFYASGESIRGPAYCPKITIFRLRSSEGVVISYSRLKFSNEYLIFSTGPFFFFIDSTLLLKELNYWFSSAIVNTTFFWCL